MLYYRVKNWYNKELVNFVFLFFCELLFITKLLSKYMIKPKLIRVYTFSMGEDFLTVLL